MSTSTASRAKRPRANTNDDPPPADLHVAVANLEALITKLPVASLQALLLSAARDHADVRDLIAARVARMEAGERARVVDFDRYSKQAWHAINTTYARLSGSKQFDLAHKAYQEVVECIKEIDKATPEAASLGTKKSALLTLRKIGKTICLGDDVVGSEVRKQFQWDSCLTDLMIRILESMGPDQLCKFRLEVGNEVLVQFEELESLAQDYCVLEGLQEVGNILAGVDGAAGEDSAEEPEDHDDQADDDDDDEENEDSDESADNSTSE